MSEMEKHLETVGQKYRRTWSEKDQIDSRTENRLHRQRKEFEGTSRPGERQGGTGCTGETWADRGCHLNVEPAGLAEERLAEKRESRMGTGDDLEGSGVCRRKGDGIR